jgi:hypothetical protein
MSPDNSSAVSKGRLARVSVKPLHPVAVLLALWFVACNGPFDPRGPLDRQLVVFSVLSTDRDIQYVRVNANYMPVSYDPSTYDSDSAVKDALVSMTGNGGSYVFRDTTVPRPDTSRYKFQMRMYTLGHFTPARGKTYNMLVSSPTLGAASASASIPTKPTIVLDPASWIRLSEPLTRLETEDIQFTVDLSSISKGYMYHLYIYYDVIKDGRWQEERVEIPLPPQIPDTSYTFDRAEYSQLAQTPQSNKIFVQFKEGYLIKAIKTLTKVKYVNTHLIYKWIVLTVLQADQNLFGYYKSLRVYQDPLSIRLDQPLYSRIDGGVGLVGAYSLDSLTFVLPENYNGNR